MAEDSVRTTCPYCGVGCGVVVSRTRDGFAIGGDPDHPANRGRLCSKGINLLHTLDDGTRLTEPMVDGRAIGWAGAIAATADRLRHVIDEHGPEAVAFYASGQLLTEDYYVANKLLKGFIGSPHIDTNSRLCMASTVAGHKRAFGADAVPGCYEDLEIADLVILVGSNLAWCHPVLFQRLKAARAERGTKVVVIDPRRTATCEIADLHLPLKPGSDVALFNGLLAQLAETGALDHPFLSNVAGLKAALETAQADVPVAQACGLESDEVATFFDWFTRTPRTVTVFSQGVNQSSQGTDKVNAILNVHLATGRVGKPGATPFSVTGQPNAMGGREVGGLANQLAAHMNPDDPADVDRLRRFWKAPALRGGQGLKAVDLFRAVEDGRIKALWIMATNPAVSLPDSDRVRAALAKCPLVIVSDVVADTDTLRLAHIRLPATAWGEKDGTVTNSERRISRQRPFRPAPGLARPDWWIISEVGRALGWEKAFSYTGPAAIFREHARLSAFENDGARAFHIGGAVRAKYDTLEPFQWPCRKVGQSTARLYGDGRFTTVDGRGAMITVSWQAPRDLPSLRWPVIANTGRYRDQWHTMTRTGLAPRLSGHRSEPLAEVSPRDAAAWNLRDGGLTRVTSPHGDALLRVRVTEDQPPGQVFLPIHWSDSGAARAVVSRLVTGHVDPVSGQPESKYTPVRLEPWVPAWQGLLLARSAMDVSGAVYWVRHHAEGCEVYDLAGDVGLDFAFNGCERIDYSDARRGITRTAWLRDGRLEAALFVGPDRPQVARGWLDKQFATEILRDADRAALLAGQAPSGATDGSRQVCACFGVSLHAIEEAVADGRARTVDDIGRLLRAGTGCGSCVSDIKEVLSQSKPNQAA
ncbi:MAG: nitrate reductase [Rhodospirillaceae bacterium BRH_c57]|nr:MAG: nitrate reductase [Rhodospirillaceae bacterium BRH_c57]